MKSMASIFDLKWHWKVGERKKFVPREWRGDGGGEWKPLFCLFIYWHLWANSDYMGKVYFEMIMLTCLIIFTLINGRFWFVFPTLILMLTSSSCNFKWIIAYLWNSTTCLLKNRVFKILYSINLVNHFSNLQTLIIYTNQKQIYFILHTFCPLKDWWNRAFWLCQWTFIVA